MNNIDRQTIIQAAQTAANQVNGPLSRTDFERITGISQYYIYKLFPTGGWSEVKKAAGLERHPKDNQPLSDEDLIVEYHRVASELGTIPTWPIFSTKATISADVIRRRFGGLQGTLKHYQEWLQLNEPESPIIEMLDAKTKHEIPLPPAIQNLSTGNKIQPWSKNEGTLYGPPIDFRGLRHAPINEHGVIFLFGMVSYELGFIVEAVHASFPDCEAKRCVDMNRNRWQGVRIEFEFQSGNFREHGHDPRKCDLIVCWEHNWPECPIEVVELRSIINNLDG